MENYKVKDSKEFIKLNIVSFYTAEVIKNRYKKFSNLSYTLHEQIKDEYLEEFGEYYPWEIKEEFPNKYKQVTEYVWIISNISSNNMDDDYINLISAPSLTDVQTYLIENHRIFVNVLYDGTDWVWYSQNMDVEDPVQCFYYGDGKYNTMQEALDMGLRVTIKDLG